jgi:hypothetical protein
MIMRILSRFMALTVLTGLLIVPISEARARIYLRIGPPPIVVEHRTVAPREGYVWQPGYHRWNGRTYVWTAGSWARPPHRYTHWVEGRWVRERRGYYWVPGHWAR